ncbi:hypothetical protein HZA56_20900 [Candidatus Poribacteria bacterium]|nr:hypothetical protein [Candidatus Poribacteria bacterium]
MRPHGYGIDHRTDSQIIVVKVAKTGGAFYASSTAPAEAGPTSLGLRVWVQNKCRLGSRQNENDKVAKTQRHTFHKSTDVVTIVMVERRWATRCLVSKAEKV